MHQLSGHEDRVVTIDDALHGTFEYTHNNHITMTRLTTGTAWRKKRYTFVINPLP